jgi:hypothetical protein
MQLVYHVQILDNNLAPIYYIIKTQDNEGPRFNNLAQRHINDGDLSA